MKRKLTEGKRQELDVRRTQHNKRLRQQGRHHEQLSFDQYVNYAYGKKSKRQFKTLNANRMPSVPADRDPKQYQRGDLTTGDGTLTKPAQPQYTGDQIIGIGTMHKSNSVPVTSAEQATDLSNMRN